MPQSTSTMMARPLPSRRRSERSIPCTTGRRVRGGSAVLIQRPALGNRLAQLLRQNELAQRHNARGDIQHDRKVVGRSRHGDGICAHDRAPARRRARSCPLRLVQANPIISGLGSNLGVIGGGAEVVELCTLAKQQPVSLPWRCTAFHRKFCRRRAQRVAGVHRSGRRSIPARCGCYF